MAKKKAKPRTTSQRLASVVKSCRDIMRKDKGLNGDLDRLPQLTWMMFLKFLDDLEAQDEIEANLADGLFQPLIPEPYRWRDWAADEDGTTGDDLLAFINNDEAVRPDGTRGPGLFTMLKSLEGGNGLDRRDVVSRVFSGTANRMLNGYLIRDVLNRLNEIHFTSSEELHTLSALYEGMLKEMRDAAGDSGEFYTPRPVIQLMVALIDPKLGEKVLDPACGTGGFLVETYEHIKKSVSTPDEREKLQRDTLFGGEAKSLPYLLGEMNLLLHGVEVPNIDYGNSLSLKLTEIGDRDRVDVILTNPPFGGEEEASIKTNFPADKQTSETALLFLQLIMRRLRRPGHPPGAKGGRAAVVVPNTTLFYSGVAERVRKDLLKAGLHTVLRLPLGVFEPYTDIETNILFIDPGVADGRVLYYRLDPPDGRTKYSKTQPLRFEEFAEFRLLVEARSDDSQSAWFESVDVLSEQKTNLDRHNPKRIRAETPQPHELIGNFASTFRRMGGRLELIENALEDLAPLLREKARWKKIRLGEALTRMKDVVLVQDEVLYKRITIQVKGRGLKVRDELLGSKIGTKRQFEVRAGQFALSKIDARNGAFGVVPDECDSAIITGNFWTYEVDQAAMRPALLKHFSQSSAFNEFCNIASPGATNRRYLQEDRFLEQVVTVPESVEDQDLLVSALDTVQNVSWMQKRDLDSASKLIPSVTLSFLQAVFGKDA